MKQEFLVRNGNPGLRVFFTGWSGERALFPKERDFYPKDEDIMLCSHYHDFYWDESLLDGYQFIDVVAWSLGVWVASDVLHRIPSILDRTRFSLAFNGSPLPMHGLYGIPPAVFEGTWKGLCGRSWEKFVLRMCGSAKEKERYDERGHGRTLEDLREELQSLYNAIRQRQDEASVFHWDLALYGVEDRIVPALNQKAVWEFLGVKACALEAAHYDRDILDRLMVGDGKDFLFPADTWKGRLIGAKEMSGYMKV